MQHILSQCPKSVALAVKHSDNKKIRCFFQQEFYDGKAPVQHALRPELFTSKKKTCDHNSCSILLPLQGTQAYRLYLRCLDSVLSVHSRSWNHHKVSHFYAKCLQETFLAVHHLLLTNHQRWLAQVRVSTFAFSCCLFLILMCSWQLYP